MYRIVCVLVFCLIGFASAAEFADCGSVVGKFDSVTVSNCGPDDGICPLKRGTNANITIVFTPTEDVQSVKAIVHGVINSLPVPFNLPHSDVCSDVNSGIKCPLSKSGGPYTYTASLAVEKVYPRLGVTVRWELQDENKRDIVCVEIPAKIQ